MDQNFNIVEYKVFEKDTLIHSGEIPLHLVVGGRGGDSSLDGMWNPEWHWDEPEYHGMHRRVEVYIGEQVLILRDDASFNKHE
jgi:hypothetical protein